MSTEMGTKINQLFHLQPPGAILQSSWLVRQGYSHDLQQRYKKSKWLQSIGTGAFIRTGESVSYEGAIYALQKQIGSNIHPGGRTALSLLGKAHYLELATKRIVLFGGSNDKLPAWFKNYDWGYKIAYYESSFLPLDLGFTEIETKNLSIKISGPIRAMLECLYLAPQKQELIECFELMEGLNNLPPKQVQMLLENCNSIKVKRLFLYMAEKAAHSWFNYIDLKNIDLGSGKRSIVKNGVYIEKYKITIPKELQEYGRNI
ncbi:type IV toxin-antitoxin system AbiEi family antitoxin [Chitinophaga nivalis]|uniref:Type IV toxin-antitoxin system AbiEi family antitoxin n=1 Tax=Chitinophaga nivalis TaxID=2991709 RepID=A0ABT3IG51_9BACT|nr:type IV toxin-antitoxin system AbiEi family antitoxin [Chitinophaga nivalis]MCW3467371.1 type IV toxin-antitoxin system AbiEi family antitoxin [Chitinophaga nivalis]MCW3482937.1 type IV toxin-antitoxin system AbiEi family antitoxin [Chitinophaga nivalis]